MFSRGALVLPQTNFDLFNPRVSTLRELCSPTRRPVEVKYKPSHVRGGLLKETRPLTLDCLCPLRTSNHAQAKEMSAFLKKGNDLPPMSLFCCLG